MRPQPHHQLPGRARRVPAMLGADRRGKPRAERPRALDGGQPRDLAHQLGIPLLAQRAARPHPVAVACRVGVHVECRACDTAADRVRRVGVAVQQRFGLAQPAERVEDRLGRQRHCERHRAAREKLSVARDVGPDAEQRGGGGHAQPVQPDEDLVEHERQPARARLLAQHALVERVDQDHAARALYHRLNHQRGGQRRAHRPVERAADRTTVGCCERRAEARAHVERVRPLPPHLPVVPRGGARELRRKLDGPHAIAQRERRWLEEEPSRRVPRALERADENTRRLRVHRAQRVAVVRVCERDKQQLRQGAGIARSPRRFCEGGG
mmetsp:Transcript_41000/g.94938  ORF Transcript_41000/g.94938 Transcript_41000/m.94938 type:complete len:325 (-) Transcript_41000:413-1387(-)